LKENGEPLSDVLVELVKFIDGPEFNLTNITNMDGLTTFDYMPDPNYLFTTLEDGSDVLKPDITITALFKLSPTENTPIQFEPFEIIKNLNINENTNEQSELFLEDIIYIQLESDVKNWINYRYVKNQDQLK
jgi:hypothetical protein